MFRAGSALEGVFGDDSHTAWKTFQANIAKMQSVWPRRCDIIGDDNDSLKKWETEVATHL